MKRFFRFLPSAFPSFFLSFATCFAFVLCLSGCVATGSGEMPTQPQISEHAQALKIQTPRNNALKAWWTLWSDPVLTRLIDSALSLNAPAVDTSALAADASFEQVKEAYFESNVELIAAVSRHYIDYRYVQSGKRLVDQSIAEHENLIASLSSLKAKKPNTQVLKIKMERDELLKRAAQLGKEQLTLERKITALTKLLPEYVQEVLQKNMPLPEIDLTPILASPSEGLAMTSQLLAARYVYARDGGVDMTDAELKSVFGAAMIGEFFGVSGDAYQGGGSLWNLQKGTVLRKASFRVVDNAFYGAFRENTTVHLKKIESILVSYANLKEQRSVLAAAAKDAQIRYSDVVARSQYSGASPDAIYDAQTRYYKSSQASLRAQYEQINHALDLYKALEAY